MEQSIELKELIYNATANKAEGFKLLYEHLVDKVFIYVKYRTSDEEVALDITQEIFVDIYKALPNFKYSSDEQFYGFVFTITKRKLAKHYVDKHTQAAKTTQQFAEELYIELPKDIEAVFDLKSALRLLDDIAREIIVLHHWSRYTFPEIATLINMKESAVRVRHHRALKTLSASINSK